MLHRETEPEALKNLHFLDKNYQTLYDFICGPSSTKHLLYNLHCTRTMYNVHCTLYTVYGVQCTLYSRSYAVECRGTTLIYAYTNKVYKLCNYIPRCTIKIIHIQRRYTQCFVLYKTNEVYIYLMSVVLFTSTDN